MKERDLFWFSFYTLFGTWKTVGMTILVCASFFCIEEDWRDGCRGKGAEVLKYLTSKKVEHCINWGYASGFMCKNLLAVTNQKKRKLFVFSIVSILLF